MAVVGVHCAAEMRSVLDGRGNGVENAKTELVPLETRVPKRRDSSCRVAEEERQGETPS